MGDFTGHMQYGLVMILFNLRWLYCTLWRYHLCRRDASTGRPNPTKFSSSITYPFRCRPSAPIEAIILMSLLMPSMAGEFYTSFYEITGVTPPGGHNLLMNGHHITLLTFYMLFPIAVILKHYKMLSIPNAEYMMSSLSHIMGFVSLWYHVYSRPLLDVHMHVLFGMLGLITSGTLLLEMNYRHSLLAILVRIASTLCMGTWFWTLAFFLFPVYGTPLDQESMKSLKIMAMAFMWNILASVVMITLLSIIAQIRTRSLSPTAVKREIRYSFGFSTYDKEGKCEQGESLLNTSDE